MTDDRYYEEAQKIVKTKKAFRSSAISFACVIPCLIILNLWTSPNNLWFFWPLLGWGMGLLGQYYEAYIKPKKRSDEMTEVEKEMEKLRLRDRRYSSERSRRDNLDDRLDLRELQTNYDERDLV